MKLDYSHSGRQFFFVTLTVAGRAKILSKLVDETARPALSAVGEVVKAALLALHQVNEYDGVSVLAVCFGAFAESSAAKFMAEV